MNQLVPIMWKNVLYTVWFLDFVTVFKESYNCQTSHYLGRNRLPNACLVVLSYLVFELYFHCKKRRKKIWVPWGNFLDKFLTGRLKTKIWLGYYVCNHQDSGAYLYLHKKAFLWHESKLPSEKHIHFEYLDSYQYLNIKANFESQPGWLSLLNAELKHHSVRPKFGFAIRN